VTKPIADKPFRCPMVPKITQLGCLLNKLKHGSCDSCPGVKDYADEAKGLLERLLVIASGSVLPMPPVVKALPGFVIPMDKERIKALESRGVGPEQAGELLEMFLSGEIFTRVEVIDPIAKSRVRPEA